MLLKILLGPLAVVATAAGYVAAALLVGWSVSIVRPSAKALPPIVTAAVETPIAASVTIAEPPAPEPPGVGETLPALRLELLDWGEASLTTQPELLPPLLVTTLRPSQALMRRLAPAPPQAWPTVVAPPAYRGPRWPTFVARARPDDIDWRAAVFVRD